MKLNRLNTSNSDILAVTNSIVYGGTLVVTNAGTNLQVGDSFQIFRSGSYSGSFSAVSLPDYYTWNTNLLASSGIISSHGRHINSKPVISHVNFSTLNSSNITLNVTNGLSGGPFSVFTSTNLALPLSNWTIVTNGTFLGDGSTNLNIQLNPHLPQSFYLIHAF